MDDTEMDEAPDAERVRWADLEYTQHAAKLARGTALNKLNDLMRACADSADPKVAMAYGTYQQAKANTTFFAKSGDRKATSGLP